jgi:uncharacterized Zn finger protein
MSPEEAGRAPQALPMSPPSGCTHSRLISNRVTEEEHNAGSVRCVECGAIVPDPYLKLKDKET